MTVSATKVSPILMGMIACLQTSLSTVQQDEKKFLEEATALITDSRRHCDTRTPSWRGHCKSKASRKCLVCKMFGCWSTKHSTEGENVP